MALSSHQLDYLLESKVNVPAVSIDLKFHRKRLSYHREQMRSPSRQDLRSRHEHLILRDYHESKVVELQAKLDYHKQVMGV